METYTLSLHDALPISTFRCGKRSDEWSLLSFRVQTRVVSVRKADRKSTRLNSSHTVISYAVFCLKKKKMLWIHNFMTSMYCFSDQVMHADMSVKTKH